MNSYLKLSIASFLPALMTAVFFNLGKNKSFSKLSYTLQQLIFGFAFGLLAVVGTEWGIPINGAQVNCRDGAVLTAGLLFGAPAGIIAGLVGGIERWFAVYWGVGTFTRVACTISTIIAGFYSAALRKYMFENKRPSWMLSLAVGIVMEVFHLTMVFITNIKNPVAAIDVVKACTAPMVTANGLSVMLSAMVITVLSHEQILKKQFSENLSQIIQRWLLAMVVIAFALTSFFVLKLQSAIADNQTESILTTAIADTAADIEHSDVYDYVNISERHHVGKTGHIVISRDGRIISTSERIDSLDSLNKGENIVKELKYRDYLITAVFPVKEAMELKNISMYVNSFLEVLVFALMFGLIYQLIDKTIVRKIKTVNKSLNKIISGDLDETVNVRSNVEFASLSDDINSTVNTLKDYIAQEAARIDQELEFAKDIQVSNLPKLFPDDTEYELYADMHPAKEVGGDFYDFYNTGRKVNFLIADVSGKGIPAAMFMMRAKTELHTLTENGSSLSDVFTHGNNALCDGNDAGMFVTAWQGSLDLDNGLVKFVNAGHNPPLVCHENGQFEFVKQRSGLVLAGMSNIHYRENELQLAKGDTLFLYTDGVTEATNAKGELYGEQRLLDFLNSKTFVSMKELCDSIKANVDKFAGDAPQFDDITMLALKYDGNNSKEISFENVSTSDISSAIDFTDSVLEESNCPPAISVQTSIVIDEILSNIIKFAYGDKTGNASLRVTVDNIGKYVQLKFSDSGIPYNPLSACDPDISLSAEERNIGGLGIFMVKKTMSSVYYEYKNKKNILIVRKNF